MDGNHEGSQERSSYEPPEVEDLPTQDDPAVTAAGDSPPPDEPIGPEWHPSGADVQTSGPESP